MASVLRELKRGELTLKDMSVMRERGKIATQQAKQTTGALTDYSLCHMVGMEWGEDYKETIRDFRPFHFVVDEKKYLLSWAELVEMDRAGFFRREPGNPAEYRLNCFDGHGIIVDTNLNVEATRDMIVRFSGKGFELFIDWYEMMRYGRFI